VQIATTQLDGVKLVTPTVHGDARGFFAETYRENVFADAGIDHDWVQENHSRSSRGVLRGMHFQTDPGQDKLVRCARGSIVDVVVDLRRGSPTYGQWEAHELSDQNMAQLYVPIGFGHGFVVTSETADVVYKCSWYYIAETERGIRFDDPDVGIEWPEGLDLQVSDRDRDAPLLRDVKDDLPFVYGPVQDPA
jgi:dTDP-4-dehydrorhamnose 3,5-epimerase